MCLPVLCAVLVEVRHLEGFRRFSVRYILQGAVVGPGRAEETSTGNG